MEGFGGLSPPLTNTPAGTEAAGCSIHTGNLSWEPENKPGVKTAQTWQKLLNLCVCHGGEQPEHQSLRNKQYFMYY